MDNSRRNFLKAAAVGMAVVGAGAFSRRSIAADVPEFAKGAEDMGPVLVNSEMRRAKGVPAKAASYFCDDVIWIMRDLTRQRPRSMFDHPFLGVLKEAHDRYGLKMQLNIFYRTDFFYGMDEFTLKEMTDAYRDEWQANKHWLKLGFHSLQEFPDYPWINADYADVKKLFGMIHGEILRFAGEGVFTPALVPHWCPMSKEGVRALKDCGVKLMECSVGPRYRYDGRPERLPYGHSFRLLQNRKPETGFYWRESRNAAISASICSYNHITEVQARESERSFNYVHDRETGMNFKHMFCDAPCLNLCTSKTLREDIAKCLGREYLIFSCHEQYFFRDYLAYQPEYAEKVLIMAKTMKENGYQFILMEELVN